MRRRIYIDPEEDLRDVTTGAYLWDLDEEFAPSWCHTGALYDEDLWREYQNACEHAYNLRNLVIRKLTGEPYDDVEREIACEYKVIAFRDGKYDHDRMDELNSLLLEHAKKQEPK